MYFVRIQAKNNLDLQFFLSKGNEFASQLDNVFCQNTIKYYFGITIVLEQSQPICKQIPISFNLKRSRN
jgi:hypothetical protein